jgi:hypothetical protein
MALTVTLGNLRDAVRDAADCENDPRVTDAKLDRVINAAIKALHAKCVAESEDDFTKTATLTTTPGTAPVDLPADFLKLRHVMWLPSGATRYERVLRFALQEFTLYDTTGGWSRGKRVQYRLIGRTALHREQIFFIPTPTAAHSVIVHYVPAPTVLTLITDTYDGRSGFEEWVICDAAIRILNAEESDVSVLMAERARIWEEQIQPTMSTRDEGQPDRVIDVEGDDCTEEFGA